MKSLTTGKKPLEWTRVMALVTDSQGPRKSGKPMVIRQESPSEDEAIAIPMRQRDRRPPKRQELKKLKLTYEELLLGGTQQSRCPAIF